VPFDRSVRANNRDGGERFRGDEAQQAIVITGLVPVIHALLSLWWTEFVDGRDI
jgi:hypothetical protein